MQQNREYVVMDLMKIFLTPPNNKKEKITVLAVMVIIFIIFFGPLCFSDMHPVRALLLSALPALSISWGWMVLLRGLFRKKEFCK